MTTPRALSKESPPELHVIGWQGAGKTTVAKQIAEEIGGIYFEGDEAIPKKSWMRWQVDNGLPVFPAQVKDFMDNHFFPALEAKRKEAKEKNKPLVVSQGLFYNRDRLRVQNSSSGAVYFLTINVSPELQKIQIAARGKAKKKLAVVTQCELFFAPKSNSFFQKPDEKLRAFTLDYFGKDSDKEEWMTRFKALPCYRDFSRYNRGESKEEGEAGPILSSLPPKSSFLSVSEKEKTSFHVPSRRWVASAAVVTLATVGGVLFYAQKLQGETSDVAETSLSLMP